ncbi:hypothetical protein D9M68_742190 [compost metagenome]
MAPAAAPHTIGFACSKQKGCLSEFVADRQELLARLGEVSDDVHEAEHTELVVRLDRTEVSVDLRQFRAPTALLIELASVRTTVNFLERSPCRDNRSCVAEIDAVEDGIPVGLLHLFARPRP